MPLLLHLNIKMILYQIGNTSEIASVFLSDIISIIFIISKVCIMLQHRSVGQVQSKECFFKCTYTFVAFLCSFSSKNLCFYHFHFLFWWSIKFPHQNIAKEVFRQFFFSRSISSTLKNSKLKVNNTVVHSAVFTGHLVYACVVIKFIFRNDNSLIMRRELTSIN